MRLVLFAVAWGISLGRAGTDFSAWKDSVRIYFNTTSTGAAISAPVRNFPLLVRLDSGLFNLSQAAPGGADIRFRDPDGTELPCHIGKWDTGFYRSAEVWVNVPQVDAGATTDYVTLFWGNPAATLSGSSKVRQGGSDVYLGGDHAAGSRVVFDSAFGFAGVWHLEEEAAGIGAKAAYRDATPAGNHGTDSVQSLSGIGVVGRAQQFDGLKDYLSVPYSPSLEFDGPMSFSAWIKPAGFAGIGVGGNVSQVNSIVRKGEVNNNPYQFCVADGRLSLSLDSNDLGGVHTAGMLSTDRWQHVGGTWDGKRVRLYVDGALQADQAPANAVAPRKDPRPVYIGGRPVNAADVNSLDLFAGSLDEVRVSRTARSGDWYRLAYENQKPGSAMLTFKAIPVKPPADTSIPVAEDFRQWTWSRKLVLNTSTAGAGVAGAVADFPLLVRLDDSLFDFAQALPDGRDLRFADADGTALPLQIERWDRTLGRAEIWVKVPKVEGSGSADYITMYWGKADAPDVARPNAVFDTADGYAGAWHLDRGSSGKGGKAVYLDATAAANHGDDYAEAAPLEAVVGLGQPFGGKSDCIRIPNAPNLNPTSSFTISAWVKGNSFYPAGTEVNVILRKGEENPNKFEYFVHGGNPGAGLEAGDGNARYETSVLAKGRWYHLAVTWASGMLRFYADGLQTGVSADKPEGIGQDDRALYIGGRAAIGADSGDQFDGILDEVEFLDTARSADWIKLSYENQRSDSRLIGFGPVLKADSSNPNDTSVAGRIVSDTLLAPGQSVIHATRYRISNPAGSAGPVSVSIRPASDRSSRGIADAGETVSLQPVAGGTMPAVGLEVNASLGTGVSLFLALPGNGDLGVVRSLGSGVGSWTLAEAGEYFLGRDTTAPVLTLVGAGTATGDTCWLEVLPRDNVANLALIAAAWGALPEPEKVLADGLPVSPGKRVRLAYKAGTGSTALRIALRLRDGTQEGTFPSAAGSAYFPERRLTGLQAPVGLRGDLDWRLVGVPVHPAEALRLGDVSGAGQGLFAAVWENDGTLPKRGGYRLLQGSDTLPTGQGIWLAGHSPLDSLSLGDARSLAAGSTGIYALKLVKGWNQVTCPALGALPWPIGLADTLAHDKSGVKWLQGIDPVTGGYVETDSLEPWRGYFVHSESDTTVELARQAQASRSDGEAAARGAAAKEDAMAKGAAAVEAPVQIVLVPVEGAARGAGTVAALRLGAARFAIDGAGTEDEPMPPAAADRAAMASLRAGRAWKTDLLAYRPDSAYSWRLAWTAGPGRERSAVRLRVASLRLPQGMVLWAASPVRKVAEPVASGGEVEVLGDAVDTLVLWAAPSGLGFPGFHAGYAPRPAVRSASWIPEAGGGRLRLALPAATSLRAECRDAAGRRIASLNRPGLAAGYYEFDLSGSWKPSAPRTVPGLMIVILDFSEGPEPGRRILSVIIP